MRDCSWAISLSGSLDVLMRAGYSAQFFSLGGDFNFPTDSYFRPYLIELVENSFLTA